MSEQAHVCKCGFNKKKYHFDSCAENILPPKQHKHGNMKLIHEGTGPWLRAERSYRSGG